MWYLRFAESRGISVREMLATYDSRELSEWQAYYLLFPEPQERADLRAGFVASLIFNVNRDVNKASPAKPDDFVFKTPATVFEDVDGEGQEERTLRSRQAMSALRG